jgi:hypothetical protein
MVVPPRHREYYNTLTSQQKKHLFNGRLYKPKSGFTEPIRKIEAFLKVIDNVVSFQQHAIDVQGFGGVQSLTYKGVAVILASEEFYLWQTRKFY